EVQFSADEAFQMGGNNLDLTLYSTVHASVYSESEMTITMAINQHWAEGVTVTIPAGVWVDLEADVATLAAGDATLSELDIRNSTGAQVLFIDNIGFNE